MLVAEIRKTTDMDLVAACKQVDDLSIWSWQDVDFKRLSHLRPRLVRLVRGRQTSLDGLNDSRLRLLWIDGPSKIPSFGPIKAPRVDIVSCNLLDLNSLGNVRGLVCVNLESMKSIDTLAFVDKCKTLVGLAFAGYSFHANDLGPLIRHRSLRLIYSNKLKNAQVEEIGTQNKRVFVCNETYAVHKGKPIESFDYGDFDERCEAFEKKYGISAE